MPHSRSHRDESGRADDATVESAIEYVVDRAGVTAIDRAATQEYGIPGVVLMENAALGVLHEARRLLADTPQSPPRVLIVCGGGNNGGDGYALARHLHNDGADVTIAALGDPRDGSDAQVNAEIAMRMKLPRIDADPRRLDDLGEFDLIVDAIFGTGLDRPVEGAARSIIEWVTGQRSPVLAVDIPSGLSCDDGCVLGTAVQATVTVTFVARKIGFDNVDAQKWLGQVTVAPIGAPIELLVRFARPRHRPHGEEDRTDGQSHLSPPPPRLR